MRCRVSASRSLFVGLLVAGAWAGEMVEEMQRDFKMGVFPRQQDGTQAQSPLNLQPFTGAVGNIAAPAIQKGDNPERPFQVQGTDQTEDLDTFANAGNKACDFQFQDCQKQANEPSQTAFDVGSCDDQNSKCKQAVETATATSFRDPTTTIDDFVIFC
ncbi:hypothetical protein F5B20DRAFT_582972 [Whalleya microplaca]|nr:hypothetical protein F5B20DRAFT_582972 [Whalleya microplaca]